MSKSLSPDARAGMRLALYLALIAGYVDAYAFLKYRVYVSFMSGNATQTGSLLGQAKLSAVGLPMLAMLFFVIGASAGSWLASSQLANPRRVLFALTAAALAITIGGTLTQPAGLPAVACIALLTMAMGLMNATHSDSLSLTVMTGTLYRVGTHLALGMRRAPLAGAHGPWDTHLHRARVGASIVAAFLIGAIASGAATLYFGVWALLPATLFLLGLALFSHRARLPAVAGSQLV
jgi:uncharacterized membrane protein YoaK (UPF0700 family)